MESQKFWSNCQKLVVVALFYFYLLFYFIIFSIFYRWTKREQDYNRPTCPLMIYYILNISGS